ncbi:MarR family transcriptional regulator [Nocardiopsis sp. NPDC049922]|uniref:winged helix-turn-helix domain-containing protein n=1 Tax=Nocardiopsis sp. NPDC049922 TaxID=3155157 RepID=UPI0033F3C6BB
MTTTTTASAARRSATRTRTRDLVLSALAEAPEPITVTALAEAVGVGRSTVGKHLPGLEKEGLAVRVPGGREGRRRLPDTWHAATPVASDTTGDGEDTSPLQVGDGATGDAAPAEPDVVPVEPDTAPDTVPEVVPPTSDAGGDDSAPRTVTEEVRVEEAPVAEVATATSRTPDISAQPAPATPPKPRAASPRAHATATAADVNPVSGSARLAPGELKLMVRAILDADPGEEFTATEISHLLQGRSIGAIQNNLARLAKDGHAVRTCDKPRRYRTANTVK